MNASKIEKGKQYEITIGKNKTMVKILSVDTRVNGQRVFDCVNVKTDKRLTVTDPKRFLREIKDEKSNPIGNAARKIIDALGIGPGSVKAKEEVNVSETKTGGGKLSGINAAFIVLKDAGEPLNIKQIMEQIIARNLAKLNGKTPHSTISAALQMEIKRKGDASRFEKAGKGLFRAK